MNEVGRSSERRFVYASLVGAIVGLAAFVIVISRGFISLTSASFGSNFYDLQARAILAGHLWIPNGSAGLEGIQIHGHTYVYFGVFLAILRIPIIWLWPDASGHLSQISMIIALCVLMASASWLAWNLRVAIRGTTSISRAEAVAQGGFLAIIAGGSVVLYLAGSPTVYFETEMWGATLAVSTLAFFSQFFLTRSRISAVLLVLSALFCALTRLNVALGPMILLLVALGISIPVISDRLPIEFKSNQSRPTSAVFLLVGLVVVVGLPAAVNWARFHSLFSVPWTKQVATMELPALSNFYRHHGVVSLMNLPSTLGWYFRPTALGATGLFPFFAFTARVSVSGHSSFLSASRTSSIPASMPILAILSLAGVLIAIRPSIAGLDLEPSVRWLLRIVVFGSLLSGVTILVFDTIANRYMADLLPFLVATSLVAVIWITGRWSALDRPVRYLVVGTALLLALFSMLVNASLALEDGFVFGPSRTPAQRASLVRLQLAIHQALPISLPFPASVGAQPPAHPVAEELFVQSGCAGVYQYSPPNWNLLEAGAAHGRRVLEIHLPVKDRTVTEPLLVAGENEGSYQYFAIEYTPAGVFRLRFESQPFNHLVGHSVIGYSVWSRAPRSRDVRMDLTIASEGPPGSLFAVATVAGAPEFDPPVLVVKSPGITVGRFPGTTERFSGTIKLQKVTTPLCAIVRKGIPSGR